MNVTVYICVCFLYVCLYYSGASKVKAIDPQYFTEFYVRYLLARGDRLEERNFCQVYMKGLFRVKEIKLWNALLKVMAKIYLKRVNKKPFPTVYWDHVKMELTQLNYDFHLQSERNFYL